MSEKRFEITEYGSDYYIEIVDNEKELDESIHNPSQKLGLVECADLLNEQQAMIDKLTSQLQGLWEDFERVVNEKSILRKENEQLKEEIEPLKQKEEVLNKIWRTYLENHKEVEK